MKSFPAICAAGCSLVMLLIFPDAAKEAVISGLETCGKIIIPSLFPFFVAINLIVELGAIVALCRILCIRSAKFAAFIIGITGGYPVGAAYIAESRRRGEISCEEASGLLVYCNNSGPAFIIGAVGTGVFHSISAGLILYAAHIISAALYGKLLNVESSESFCSKEYKSADFSSALTTAVKKSVSSIINVCGFVLAFSVVLKLLNANGLISVISGKMAELTHTQLKFNYALITGLFEIGNCISEMQGLLPSPLNMALAAFILGWGGFSVHFQTLSLIAETDIKTARYIIGRFLIAVMASAIAFLTALIFRI
ncbi:MAG: hypothetical protein Q4A83_01595 [Bacillota bacterium]|nr:hypothetical protein [Bacillota bacterium]